MRPHPRTDPTPDISASPLYLLAVLFAARRSKDPVLEHVTRRRLNSLGVRITFGDELPAPDTTQAKGAAVAEQPLRPAAPGPPARPPLREALSRTAADPATDPATTN